MRPFYIPKYAIKAAGGRFYVFYFVQKHGKIIYIVNVQYKILV